MYVCRLDYVCMYVCMYVIGCKLFNNFNCMYVYMCFLITYVCVCYIMDKTFKRQYLLLVNYGPSQYKHKYHIKDPSQVCPKYVVNFSVVATNGLPPSQSNSASNNNSTRYCLCSSSYSRLI